MYIYIFIFILVFFRKYVPRVNPAVENSGRNVILNVFSLFSLFFFLISVIERFYRNEAKLHGS